MRSAAYLAIAAIIAFLLAPATAPAQDEGLVRIGLIQGDVQISGKDMPDWTDASINMPLIEGDRVWVPDDGRAEVEVRGGFSLRLDEKSSLDVLSLENGSIQFYLDRGHAYVNNRRGGVKIVQIEAPLASVRSYDNSIMMLDVSEEGQTEVSVLKGYVYAESRAGSTRVAAGSTLTIREDGSADLAPIGPPDEWEQWNTDRDRRQTAWGESGRYLPDDLQEYSSDFDANGRWEYVGDYGYCWVPVVMVVDWAPYTAGRWIWRAGRYVWISFEPWGWAPYHYGRWVFISSIGWCWVPPLPGAVYWGPGFVGWVVTPSYVAWVPLAPGEVYYGYGYFGPGSVNITNVNINTVVVNETYRNASVRNAVTVVRKDSFGTGQRTPVTVRENPFLARGPQKFVAVPPNERPRGRISLPAPAARLRETEERYEGTIKPSLPERRAPAAEARTPERILPPERVIRTQPEELKTQRRIVKEKEASVFRPERPAPQMEVRRQHEPKVIMRRPASQPGTQRQQKREEGKGKRDRD